MPPNLLHCGCLVCINSEKLRSGVPKDAPWKRSVRARLGAQNWEFFEQLAGWDHYRNIPIHPLQLLEDTHQDAFLSFFQNGAQKNGTLEVMQICLIWADWFVTSSICWSTSSTNNDLADIRQPGIRIIPGKDTGGAKPGLRIWMNLGVTHVFFHWILRSKKWHGFFGSRMNHCMSAPQGTQIQDHNIC